MKLKLLLSICFIVALQFTYVQLHAQSQQELNELMSAPPAQTKEKGKAKKEQPKKEEAKPEKKEAQPKAEEKKAEPAKQETAKPQETKKEEPKQEETKQNTQEKSIIKESGTNATAYDSKNGRKYKELPDPKTIGWKRNRKLGDLLMEKGSVYNAIHYYEAAVNKKSNKIFLYQRLADANFVLRDYRFANKYYKVVVDMDSVKHKNLFALYQAALTDKYLGNYEQAKATFSKFNKLAKNIDELNEARRNATREIQGCDSGLAQLAITDMREFKATHLNENINQPFTDYAPVLKDENTIYYGSWVSDRVILENRREKYADFSRIYTAKRNGKMWEKAVELKDAVNSANMHTGNPTFSRDGNTMYYTQCQQDEMSRMRCNIYKSSYSAANGWSEGEKLSANVNQEGATNTHPAIGKNDAGELVLFFASDRNAEKGMDIYYAKINDDGSFGKAKPIGPAINTKGNEETPSYDFKNDVLYFSSDGRVNIGGLDVYRTKAVGGDWSEPVNMGMPINSSVDDMYFNWNDYAGVGFVVSNRPGGFGIKSETCCDDIYQVEKEKLLLAVKGTIQNADSSNKAIENGLITLFDGATGKEIKSYYATDGSYFFDLEAEKDYKLIARKNGFEDADLPVSTIGKRFNDTVTVDVPMKMRPQLLSYIGQRIGIVYWDFNKDILTDGAPDTLNTVTTFMNEHPTYVLEVGSHTDAKGTDEYNLKLSQRRSDAVIKYLASKKIPMYRLQSKAYGESQPVDLNENPPGTDYPEGRSKNRRTEFKVVQELTPEQIAEAEAKAKAFSNKAKALPPTKNTTTSKPAEKPKTDKPADKAKPAQK